MFIKKLDKKGGGFNAAAYGSSSLDASTIAWVNAVVAAGGTVSAAQQTNVNTLIVSLKSHSLWTIQDRIWLHANENVSQQALIDIVNLGVATVNGSITLAAGGYTGDGSTGYLDSGYSSGSNFSQNSGSFSQYIRNSRTSNSAAASGRFDAASTGGQSLISPYNFALMSYDVNNGQFSNQPANTNAQGFWTASRTASNAIALYKNSNSTAFDSQTTASITLPGALNFYIAARNQNGTPNLFSADQIAITTIGAGMSAANTSQFQTDLNTYMQNLPGGSLAVY